MAATKDWRAISRRLQREVDPMRWYSVPEVAELLGINRGNVGTYAQKDELPGREIGGNWKVRGKDLVAFAREKAYFAPRPKAA